MAILFSSHLIRQVVPVVFPLPPGEHSRRRSIAIKPALQISNAHAMQANARATTNEACESGLQPPSQAQMIATWQ